MNNWQPKLLSDLKSVTFFSKLSISGGEIWTDQNTQSSWWGPGNEAMSHQVRIYVNKVVFLGLVQIPPLKPHYWTQELMNYSLRSQAWSTT